MLRSTGFYVGGFNPVVDYGILPAVMGLLAVAPRGGLAPAGRLLAWGLRRFSRPPFGTLLRLEARGAVREAADGATTGGAREGVAASAAPSALAVEVYHEDGYVLTAAPMVACLLQLLDGSARVPGLHFQALLVEPTRALADLQRLGIEVVVLAGGAAVEGEQGRPASSSPNG